MSKYAKWGLNQSVAPTRVEVKRGENTSYLEVAFKVGVESKHDTVGRWPFPLKAIQWRKGQEPITHTQGEYYEVAKKRWKDDVLTVLALIGGMRPSELADKMANERPSGSDPIAKAEDWMRTAVSFLPPDWKDNSVDLFLEYETKVREGKDRRYLTVPMSSQDGEFITKGSRVSWIEDFTNGLTYTFEGRQHPFSRSAGYMKSKRAVQDIVAEPKSTPVPPVQDSFDDDLPF